MIILKIDEILDEMLDQDPEQDLDPVQDPEIETIIMMKKAEEEIEEMKKDKK